MSTPISLWNGKVRKISLPVFDNPAESAPTEPKRLRLGQGELAQIFTGSPGIHYLAALELRAGTLRGNHSHERKHEFVYVISGRMEIVCEETKAHHQERFICQAGDLVEIAPGIAHAFRVLESGTGLEFSPQEFDASDVQRCRLLESP
jgi:mannose-6-phosphate isomerase-like protein (cupin superfamily)